MCALHLAPHEQSSDWSALPSHQMVRGRRLLSLSALMARCTFKSCEPCLLRDTRALADCTFGNTRNVAGNGLGSVAYRLEAIVTVMYSEAT